MINSVDIFLTIIISFGYLLISSKLHRNYLNFKKAKVYIAVFVLAIFIKLSFLMEMTVLKGPMFILLLTLINSWLFESKLKDSIVVTIVFFLLLTCTDIIFSIVVINFDLEQNELLINIYNIAILGLDYLLLKLSVIKKIVNYITNQHQKNVIVLIGILILIMYFFSTIYQQSSKNYTSLEILFIYIFIILNIIFLFFFLLEKGETARLSIELQELKKIQEIQESFIKEYQIKTHEYINHLTMLKSVTNNKKINSYINVLLTEAMTSNDKNFFSEIENLPFFMLKSFIICKYFKSRNKDIILKIEIGSKVEELKESALTAKQLTNMIDVIGVFVDNAIEEVQYHTKKEFKINIFKNNQNQLLISVINKIEKKIINMEDMLGNTTKGQGHGHGLLLVKKIIKKNPKFKHTTEYISDIFIQNLIIDLK